MLIPVTSYLTFMLRMQYSNNKTNSRLMRSTKLMRIIILTNLKLMTTSLPKNAPLLVTQTLIFTKRSKKVPLLESLIKKLTRLRLKSSARNSPWNLRLTNKVPIWHKMLTWLRSKDSSTKWHSLTWEEISKKNISKLLNVVFLSQIRDLQLWSSKISITSALRLTGISLTSVRLLSQWENLSSTILLIALTLDLIVSLILTVQWREV